MVKGKQVPLTTVLACFWLRKVEQMTFPAIGKAFSRKESWARRQVQKVKCCSAYCFSHLSTWLQVETHWTAKNRGGKRVADLDDNDVLEHVVNCCGATGSLRDMMQIMRKRGYEGSKNTLHRRLKAAGYRVVNKIFDDLTVRHKQVRVEFCHQQQQLIEADPNHHLRYRFSDEASFSLQNRKVQVEYNYSIVWTYCSRVKAISWAQFHRDSGCNWHEIRRGLQHCCGITTNHRASLC